MDRFTPEPASNYKVQAFEFFFENSKALLSFQSNSNLMEHTIQMEEVGNKGSFYVEKDGNRIAEMTFSKAGENMIIIDHTEVSDSLRGTGTGKAMVLEAVKWAREKNIKIMPLCPFANSVFKRNPDIRDVL